VEMRTIPPLRPLPPDPPGTESPESTDPEASDVSHSGSGQTSSGSAPEDDTDDGGTPPDLPLPPNTPKPLTYYSQRDIRWGEKELGCGNMKNNGCGPSAIAMAMSAFGIEVTPYETAEWLYENTVEFNRSFHGISGTGLKLGLEHFGRTVEPVRTYEEFLGHLNSGAVIVGCQGQGHFVSGKNSSHCITMTGIDDSGMVTCYDPFTPKNNGLYHAEDLWEERSKVPVDLRKEGVTHYAVY